MIILFTGIILFHSWCLPFLSFTFCSCFSFSCFSTYIWAWSSLTALWNIYSVHSRCVCCPLSFISCYCYSFFLFFDMDLILVFVNCYLGSIFFSNSWCLLLFSFTSCFCYSFSYSSTFTRIWSWSLLTVLILQASLQQQRGDGNLLRSLYSTLGQSVTRRSDQII